MEQCSKSYHRRQVFQNPREVVEHCSKSYHPIQVSQNSQELWSTVVSLVLLGTACKDTACSSCEQSKRLLWELCNDTKAMALHHLLRVGMEARVPQMPRRLFSALDLLQLSQIMSFCGAGRWKTLHWCWTKCQV